jgi:hypothetical protein
MRVFIHDCWKMIVVNELLIKANKWIENETNLLLHVVRDFTNLKI